MLALITMCVCTSYEVLLVHQISSCWSQNTFQHQQFLHENIDSSHRDHTDLHETFYMGTSSNPSDDRMKTKTVKQLQTDL